MFTVLKVLFFCLLFLLQYHVEMLFSARWGITQLLPRKSHLVLEVKSQITVES